MHYFYDYGSHQFDIEFNGFHRILYGGEMHRAEAEIQNQKLVFRLAHNSCRTEGDGTHPKPIPSIPSQRSTSPFLLNQLALK